MGRAGRIRSITKASQCTFQLHQNMPSFVPQSYLFAHHKTPVKFAFWDPHLGSDQQTGSIPNGSVVSLVAWIPNNDKPGFVCIHDSGDEYDLLPGSPNLDKIAQFKLNYQGAKEVPLSIEERRRAEVEQHQTEREDHRTGKESMPTPTKPQDPHTGKDGHHTEGEQHQTQKECPLLAGEIYKMKNATYPHQCVSAKDMTTVALR